MMRHSRAPFFLLGLVGVATCSPASTNAATGSAYAIKDQNRVPLEWRRIGAPSPQQVLTVQIGLKQDRYDELEKHLNQVSDPDHSRYGQHLSGDEVNELLKPSKETDSLVRSWLGDHGIQPEHIHCSQAGDWLKVNLPVEKVEKLLNTTYSTYRHDEDESQLIRAPIWALPMYLHDHVETIQPTTSFMRPRARLPRTTSMFQTNVPETAGILDSMIPFSDETSKVCDPVLVTPDCLRSYFGTKGYTAKGHTKMAMTNYLEELSNRSDASLAFQKFRPDALSAASAFKLISVNGGTTQQTPNNASQLLAQTGVEGALDTQTLIGIAYPLDLIVYSTGGRNPDFKPDLLTPTNSDEPYLEWTNYMLALPQDQLPSVVSTSYADNEQTVGRSYARSVCRQFAALGARGVSLLFGSGDEGVGANKKCYSNDGRNATLFTPEFPSSCPWVTTIGGTYKFNPEVAALDTRFKTPYTSGAGFSEVFPMPEYQWDAVKPYLDNNQGFPNYTGFYNPTGRAYPDFSAQSQNYSVVWNGSVIPVDGTSAATPAAAALIALVNDALVSAGKPVLGFLNPWLYKSGFEAFNDILSGSSAGCETDGFPAQKGWDAVTGFGTPYFPDILKNLGIADQLDPPAAPPSKPTTTPTKPTSTPNKPTSTPTKPTSVPTKPTTTPTKPTTSPTKPTTTPTKPTKPARPTKPSRPDDDDEDDDDDDDSDDDDDEDYDDEDDEDDDEDEGDDDDDYRHHRGGYGGRRHKWKSALEKMREHYRKKKYGGRRYNRKGRNHW